MRQALEDTCIDHYCKVLNDLKYSNVSIAMNFAS